MKVLVLAAGYGTRLQKIAKDTPKPLLQVGKKSLINHILEKVEKLNDLNEVLVVTNNKFYEDFKSWAENEDFPAKITVVNDGTTSNEDRLGSVGDINFVLNQGLVDDDLLIVGGDNLFDFNLVDYHNFAKQKSPSVSIGIFDIENIEESKKFGVVAVDEEGKITSFEEKPENPKSSLIAMCFYYLPKDSLTLVGEYLNESKKSDKAGDYIKWLCEKGDVYGFKFDGTWYDIGSVESYNEAQAKFS